MRLKSKRVLVLAPGLSPRGGIGRYSRHLVEALCEIYGADNVPVLALEGPLQGEESDRYRVLGYGGSCHTRWSKVKFIFLALFHMATWRPMVVVCTHVNLSPIALVGRWLFRTQYMVVAYGIEVWNKWALPTYWGMTGAITVVTISEFTRNIVAKQMGEGASKIKLVPPTVDRAFLSE